MPSVRMRFVMLVVYVGIATAASIKKSIKDPDETNSLVAESDSKTASPPIPAIIAIEIVNGSDGSDSTKSNSKRTIESSLGYGYHNPSGSQTNKKFVIYKYTKNIPAHNSKDSYKGSSGSNYNSHSSQSSHGSHDSQANVQKSVGYHLGSTITHIQKQPSIELQHSPPTQYYYPSNPSTTLYTTLSQQGQVGHLSNNIPYQNLGHAAMVPVIILRIYSSQLTNPNTALHTNLPESSPYSGLNHINLQSLLQTYVQQYLQHQYQPTYQQSYQDNQQSYEGHQQTYQYHQNHQQSYQPDEEYHSNLPTSENYPSQHHTRVIFHSNNNGHIPETPKAVYKTSSLAYNTVSIPTYKAPQTAYQAVEEPQYTYTSASQADQPYMYIYPSQLAQLMYYQQDYQQDYQHQYQLVPSPDDEQRHVPPTATQESPETPYNYHAHSQSSRPSPKHRRSKKTSTIFTLKQRSPRET